MVYSRYIYGCGPYRYKSAREGNKVHSIYLGKGGAGGSDNELYTTPGEGRDYNGKTRKDLNTKKDTDKTEEYKMKVGSSEIIKDRIVFPAQDIGAGQQRESHSEVIIQKVSAPTDSIRAKHGDEPYFVQFQSYDVIIDRNGQKHRRPATSDTGSRYFNSYDEACKYAKGE